MSIRSFFAPTPGTKWFFHLKRWEKNQHRPNQMIIIALLVGLLIGVAAAYCTSLVMQNGGIPGFPDLNP